MVLDFRLARDVDAGPLRGGALNESNRLTLDDQVGALCEDFLSARGSIEQAELRPQALA
jgi:hypothetical protein